MMFKFITHAMMPISLLLYCLLAEAGGTANPITVTFENGMTMFAHGAAGTARYLVKVNSGVVPAGYPLTMSVGSLPAWATQDTVSGSACTTTTTNCTASISLSAGEYCCLMLNLDGTQLTAGSYSIAPIVATTPKATYQGQAAATTVTVTAAPQTTTILISPAANVPQILTADGVTTLVFTITNTGAATATTITATQPGGWSGVNIVTSPGCASLAPASNNCTFTLTSSMPNLAKQFTVQGTNTGVPISSPYVAFDTHGGLVFSVSGTSPAATAKVVSKTDNNPIGGIIWGSNGSGGTCTNYPTVCDVSFDIIPGIDETSTTTPSNESPSYSAFTSMFNGTTYSNAVPTPVLNFTTCAGKNDGSCNSGNIVLFYNTYTTNYNTSTGGPYTATKNTSTNTADYAAGICSTDMDGGASAGDWYLPAICELGTYSNPSGGTDAGCGINIANVETNLYNFGFLSNLSTTVLYWSSTEDSGNPQYHAWFQVFVGVGDSSQSDDTKYFQGGVRCVRAFTY